MPRKLSANCWSWRLLDTIQFPSPLPRLIRRPLMNFIITRVAKYKNEQIFRILEQLMADDVGAEQTPINEDGTS